MSQSPKVYPDDPFSTAALRAAKWMARCHGAVQLRPIHLVLGFALVNDDLKVVPVSAYEKCEKEFSEVRASFELPPTPALDVLSSEKMSLSDAVTELLKRSEGNLERILEELRKIAGAFRVLCSDKFSVVMERACGVAAVAGSSVVGPEVVLAGAYAALTAGELKAMRAETALLSANRAAIEALLLDKSWVPLTAPRSKINPWLFSDELISRLLDVPEAKNPLVAALNIGIGLGARLLSKERTAYHEAGHAVVSYTLRPELTIAHVTIIESESSDGCITFEPTSPFWERFRRVDLLTGVRVAMGGRVAEQIKFGADEADTGAQADIEQATKMAWKAITQSGLDHELGPVNLSVLSELTASSRGLLFDKAQERLQSLLKEAVTDVQGILQANWPKVEAVALALLKGRELGDDDLLSVLVSGTIAYLPGTVLARSRPLSRKVTFAPTHGVLQTLEGPARYHVGDAIVHGETGESWPVSRETFERLYRPRGDTIMGQDGIYSKIAREVAALQLEAASRVDLSDGRGMLVGKRSDWLVDYGNGDLAIVSGPVFLETYELDFVNSRNS